jgi:hexosaminidase
MNHFLIALVAAASLAWPQELKLVPAPRSVERGQGQLVLRSPVGILVAVKEDRVAAETLAAELKDIHGFGATVGESGNPAIRILRAGTPDVDQEIERLGLDRTALSNDEGYVLHVNPSGALVAARTAAGVFYGVQTLCQLITPGGRVPAVAIGDWPALRYRGLSVDISRGPFLTEDRMKELIRTAAEFKLNILSFYMEHVFPYRHAPIVAPEGGVFSPELAQRLAAYARRYHVDLVPQQQTFGHLHHMLKFERYAELAEVPHGFVITPESERTYEWIREVCRQLADAFPSTFLHIGSDETWELGEGRARPEAERIGVGNVYVRHMQRVGEMLRPVNRKLMFWGDIALRHAELIPKLPRNLVAMTWVYSPKDDFSSYIGPFRDAGFEFFVCPGLNNWNRIFPNVSDALANINNFVRDGKKAGALGMFNTHWADDGEALFNDNWYGILYSAAAAWQPGDVSKRDFEAAFDWAFYRNSDETFASMIQRLDQVHQTLRSAGVGDASTRLFWFDPFSLSGATTTAKIHPVASEVRLLAEGVLADLEAHTNKARRHRDTLAFLQLAAKRLDYLGMKAQFARRIGELYREALAAQAPRNLSRINSTNGLIQDLRDYANEIKGLYRSAWLAENRPYWLDNVLVRHDYEALLWTGRARLFTEASQQYATTKKMPEPEKLGLHLP